MKKNPNARMVLTLASMAIASAAFGYPDDIVVHKSNGSSPFKTELSKTSRITFQGSSMMIKEAGGPAVSIPLRDIARIVFDLSTSSSEEMESNLTEELKFIVERKKVKLISVSGGDVELFVFDAAGHQVGAVSSKGETEYDFTDKEAGVYILTSAGKSIKYLNK